MHDFVHLHLHTQYSLLDGAIRLPDLIKRIKKQGGHQVAITDHGNMFGAMTFCLKVEKINKAEKEAAKEEGREPVIFKPIYGVEAYVAKGDLHVKEKGAFHLVLLARTLEGYRNLCRLCSIAYREGFYYHPRIDLATLKQHSEGLIGLSACLGGQVAKAILNEGMDAAREVIERYRQCFEPGCFYLEVQANGLPEQQQVNRALRTLGQELDLPLVATNDCHYLNREDAKAHDILMCIQTGKTLDDPTRLHHDVDAYWLKSPEEMWADLGDEFPDALENTVKIANECNVEIPHGTLYLPKYQVPEGYDIVTYLQYRARTGLEERFKEFEAINKVVDREMYKERLEKELNVIIGMDFPGYFMIVQDFINWAKSQHIPVGPGRGSGAGSLVAYSLRITDLDPLPYNLLFERFLNPERVSMPDFDVDFCMNRRTEVIDYVASKYGKDNVGQIATFGSLKARGVIKDVGRVLGMNFAETDKLAKLVPEVLNITLAQAIEQEPRLKELYDQDEKIKFLLDVSQTLEGLLKSTGMHAAGVVIGQKPLWEYCPVFVGNNDEMVTQYAKEEVEEAGLVKFDFLGLKTLTVIDDAVQLINRHRPEKDHLHLAEIPLDDPKVYELISRGDTDGVFQLESSGFKDLLKKLKPDTFEDIIAVVALYRPGPLDSGMLDDFIKRKQGLQEIKYPHPCLEKILKDTYGVIVYQEQVMQISQVMAGYTLGGADLLRRAMGKKKVEVMQAQRAVFQKGAEERGIDPKIATDVFDLMEKFAAYGFNKSHSAAYALLTYQTAYLKLYHKAEFMAAALTCDQDCAEKIAKGIRTARKCGVEVLPPSVNQSFLDFDVVDGKLLFGMGGLKGVGANAAQAIVEAREADGPFKDFFDFCSRVDLRRVNKKTIEALINSGGFNFCNQPRARLCAALDLAIERAQNAQRDRDSGQSSFFDLLAGPSSNAVQNDFPQELMEVKEFPEPTLLEREKASLGFYISGHPLDRFREQIDRFATCTVEDLPSRQNYDVVTLAGIQSALRIIPLKNGGGRFCSMLFEDLTGQVEVTTLGDDLNQYEELLRSDEPLLITCQVRIDEDDDGNKKYSLRIGRGKQRFPKGGAREQKSNEIDPDLPLVSSLQEIRAARTRGLTLKIKCADFTGDRVQQLKRILSDAAHQGKSQVMMQLVTEDNTLVTLKLPQYNVTLSDDLTYAINQLFDGACEQHAA